MYFTIQWASAIAYNGTMYFTRLPQKNSENEVRFYLKSTRLSMQHMYPVRSLCMWTFPPEVE